MALKNTKISRELTRQLNRYFTIKSDASLNKPEAQNIIQNDSHIRYTLSYTEKPNLPKIEFSKDVDEMPANMKHLQPSRLPNFIEGPQEPKHVIDKWTDSFIKRKMQPPFPQPIKEISVDRQVEYREPGIRVTVKANKLGYSRNFHTNTNVSPFKTVSRFYASHDKCKKDDGCPKKPKKCKKNLTCPHFVMDNCPPMQARIGCKRENIDPDCKKVKAPYKSYSELCAQRLPDDPSECMQCPWQKCGGVDDIKPPKRKYHTATLAQTINSSQTVPGLFYDCDAKKKPCRPPPPKCKKDPCQKEQCPEVKRRCPNPCGLENTSFNKKKCSDWSVAFRLWSDKEHIFPDKEWLDMQVMPIVHKMTHEQGLGSAINYEMKKCPKEKSKCPKKEKPRIKIDTTIDICKGKGKKKKERSDKGNPPPCPTKPIKQSEYCPKEQKKLPYRKERDFKRPYYKRPDEPYADYDDN